MPLASPARQRAGIFAPPAWEGEVDMQERRLQRLTLGQVCVR